MLALAISPNRRYLAISETLQDKPTITVYELSSVPCKKRKILNNFDFPVQEFISLAFSPDSKYLVAQTGPPESNLAYWMWEKQRTMAIIKVDVQNNPLYQVRWKRRMLSIGNIGNIFSGVHFYTFTQVHNQK